MERLRKEATDLDVGADLIEAYARPAAPGDGDAGRDGDDERTDGSETR
jgi:hypothetical protein